jgi:RNA polymerase sigma factor (sigma-70 family)
MAESLLTRHSLLLRVRNLHDQEAWAEFVDIYGPVIHAFARKCGLQDADAADLTQIVLQAIMKEIQRLDYAALRAPFRAWLFGVVRNQVSKYLRKRRGIQGTGDTGMQDLLEQQRGREDAATAVWDCEYERQLFHYAAAQVQGSFEESSWLAFWRTAVEGKSAKDTAAELGLSVGAIYTAKSRVLHQIRKHIQELQGEEHCEAAIPNLGNRLS